MRRTSKDCPGDARKNCDHEQPEHDVCCDNESIAGGAAWKRLKCAAESKPPDRESGLDHRFHAFDNKPGYR